MPPSSAPIKVKRRKVRVVKAPAGDVASSGAGYGIAQAKRAATSKPVVRAIRKVYDQQPVARRQQIVRNATGPVAAAIAPIHQGRVTRNRDLAKSQAQHDVPGADMVRAQRYLSAHPEILKPPKPHQGVFGSVLGTAAAIAPKYAAAVFPAATSAAAAIDKLSGTHILHTAGKVVSNIPRDAAELAVGTPSSVAKLASTAVHDPKKVPGMLAAPYKELYHHPGQFLTEHPVSAALMVTPAGRIPGKVVGKGLRVTGKQTLARPAASLPGTALREQRTASRDALVNAVQHRKDRKAGPQTMTDAQVQRRVDEFYAAGQKHKQRVEAAATRQAKALPKDERQAHITGALGGADKQLHERFAQEFGASAYRTPEGITMKPKNPTTGALHDTRPDAEAIAKAAPFDAVVRKVGERYAVLPRVAADRLGWHMRVGTSPSVGARVLRSTRSAFTSTVLPLSPKWLTGNAVESALRSFVAGAGPTGYVRATRAINKLEQQVPGAGRSLQDRAAGGGYFGGTIREMPRRTFEEELAGSKLANIGHALTKAGAHHGPKEVHQVWRAVTDFVFNTVNGKMEGVTQRAMLGKALKNSPLMERSIIGLSDRAMADAVKGLHNTEAQVALGRAVDRMYGRYSKFSPAAREQILHWTPFAPWYGNAVTFLTKVLPVDHPVLTSILAANDAATEDWRKAAGLSLRGGGTVPSFLLGGYPSHGGILRVGRYTPFGASADPTQAVSDLFLPQLRPALDNLGGIDWRGQRLKHPGHNGKEFNQGERAVRAAVTLIEAMVPGVAQAGRVTGLTPRYIDKQGKPSVIQGKKLGPALNKEFNPFVPSSPPAKGPQAWDGWGTPPGGSSGWGGRSGWGGSSTGWGTQSGRSGWGDALAKKYGPKKTGWGSP